METSEVFLHHGPTSIYFINYTVSIFNECLIISFNIHIYFVFILVFNFIPGTSLVLSGALNFMNRSELLQHHQCNSEQLKQHTQLTK